MTTLARAGKAARAPAEHRQRKTVLDDVIALADASVAACREELNRAAADRLREQARRLNQIVREHADRSESLGPSGLRIAPRRIAPPTPPPKPCDPDTFVAAIASRLRHP
ncbi:hypothetical protein ACSFA7_22565 [Variovorax sp. LT1R20]|uniref:hypothetical protein n=1 Tax=Variovorax sp. LT1R20 TaxID=3443729 RepID=UPI003F470FF9